MGVDIPKNRHSRKKDDDLELQNKAWDKPNLFDEVFVTNTGNLDIQKTTDKLEKLMHDTDKGKFLGFGKDGKLDGKEISGAVEKLSKQYGIEIPAELRQTLREMSQDKNFKIDIKEATQELQAKLNGIDKNHDGAISPKEMTQALQSSKGRD